MTSRASNFSAGPAALPLPALERARDELLDFGGSGMSVMEQSHRGKIYEAVHQEALRLVAELLALPTTHEVLFVQGGASQAFAQIPMNFVEHGKVADYVINGAWGEKAFAEARAMVGTTGGGARMAHSPIKGETYTRLVKDAELELRDDAAYLHVTSNETVHGIAYALTAGTPFPKTRAPIVCDMSSDIFGRVLDMSIFDLVYAGAQKNIGPSGVTLVIVKKDWLATARKDLPAIFQYRVHAENGSLYNTPPTFGVYLVRNVLTWVKEMGGVAGMEARNRAKAQALYDVIEGSGGFYRCPVEPAARSIMNVVWRLPTTELEEAFVKKASAARMIGLKGHRVAGGIRASLYNAVEPAWVSDLASFMKDFAKENG